MCTESYLYRKLPNCLVMQRRRLSLCALPNVHTYSIMYLPNVHCAALITPAICTCRMAFGCGASSLSIAIVIVQLPNDQPYVLT